MNDYESKMLEYARKKWGVKALEELTHPRYREAALAVRNMREKLAAARRAGEARLATAIGLRVVPDEVAARNEAICKACPKGKYKVLSTGEPVCNNCGCSNRMLRSKWQYKKEHCPHLYWDNRKVNQSEEIGPLSAPVPGLIQDGGGAV